MTATAESKVLTARQICCFRSHRPLFEVLDFQLQPGAGIYLGGPNGSGKTTLLRALVGLSDNYDGEFCWGGVNTRRCADQFHSELLYLGHLPASTGSQTPKIPSFLPLF